MVITSVSSFFCPDIIAIAILFSYKNVPTARIGESGTAEGG